MEIEPGDERIEAPRMRLRGAPKVVEDIEPVGAWKVVARQEALILVD